MERLREIELELDRIVRAEKKLRMDKMDLRDRAREAGLVIDCINNKVIEK